MNELWKFIPGFSMYQASNTGKLRSLNYKRTGKTKEFKPAISGGYLKTMLQDDNGKYRSKVVHYFVTLAFFGGRDGNQSVNHKDGNKMNNSIDNLEYCSISENILHAYNHDLINPKRGTLNGMAKLTEQDVAEIRNHAASHPGRYYGRKSLAIKYGVSQAHIKDIVTKRRNIWPHV